MALKRSSVRIPSGSTNQINYLAKATVTATRRGVNCDVNMPHFHTLWGFANPV